MLDTSSYWGMFALPEMGGSCYSKTFIGEGVVCFLPYNDCKCSQGFTVPQIGVASTDESNEEQFVQYRWERSMRSVQEDPVRRIGVNFGGICDRWDETDQLLWTHHPMHPPYMGAGNQGEPWPLIPVQYRGNVTNQYHYSGAMTSSSSNSHVWVSGSYVKGMTGLTLPLALPLIATRGTPTLPLTGYLNDVCWSNCVPTTLKTISCDTNARRASVMMCYDATNLYIGGLLHQPGARPNVGGGVCPVYMKVALGGRDRLQALTLPIQLDAGESAVWVNTLSGVTATNCSVGTNCVGLASNAWRWAYATNVEMFTGVFCVPWTNLVAAGVWTSQLVMNVEVCGDLLDGTKMGWCASDNQLTTELPSYSSPVYFDAARGPVAEVIPHTVRLYFAEMEGLTNGQRVFDVQLQGQTVLTNVDVFSACGGKSGCEIIREFTNVGIADKLNIDFVAHAGQPILGGVEIITTGTNAANQPPVALLDANTVSGPAPLDVQFSAQRSYDPDGQIVECAWDTGDGHLARGSLLHHIFSEPGTYQVCLLVTDNRGATAASMVPVTVTAGVPAAFICNIRSTLSTNVTGGDYTKLSDWATAIGGDSGSGGDLLSTTTLFRVSAYGSVKTVCPVTFPGGPTGMLRCITSWVTNGITNTYAEVAYVGGTGTITTGTIQYYSNTSYWFTITDTGTVTRSLLFTVPATNTYLASKDDNQVVFFPGGGMGKLKHINHASPNIAYITECSGTIRTGTVLCATTGHSFSIGDTGYPVVTLVADCYNDWTNGLNNATTLQWAWQGWTWITDPNHCLVIRSAAGQGHQGKILGTNGNYTGFTLTAPLIVNGAPYTRIRQISVGTNTITVGPGCSVSRVLGSVAIASCQNGVAPTAVTIANSIGPVFSTGTGQDISFHNCTGGSFLLPDVNLNYIRAINCLAYSSAAGFATTLTNEIWLSHCVSVDGTATGADGWKDGNEGNLANQAVSFVNAGNDYHLAASDIGAHGQGQPGLGADIDGNLRTGPVYDVGAHQITNVLSAFQLWQIANFGSITASGAASNAVNSAGISNWQMFLAGSNPNDSNTWFRFTTLAPVTGNKWEMNFNTVSGRSYTVTWKTNLLDGLGWQFYTNLQGFGGSTQVTFTNTLPQAFFQIQAQ